MPADQFRELALSFSETEECSHMGRPRFRVGGKILTTLGPDGGLGIVKLQAKQQPAITRTDAVFVPANEARGKTWFADSRTRERLMTQRYVRHSAARSNIAPKKLT